MESETAKQDDPMTACCADSVEAVRHGATQTEPCPMSAMCQAAMKKTPLGFVLAIAGAALVAGGALILLEPAVLVWLMAGTSILLGIGMLAMATFVRRRACGASWT